MIFPWRQILTALCMFLLPASTIAVTEPPPPPMAADLVTDGQLIDISSPRYRALFTELRQKYRFTQEELDYTFIGVSINKRVLELMDTQWEAKPYYQYYPRFITPTAIREGKQKLEEHKALLDEVERKLGVEREIVVAIWGIETHYGSNEGSFGLFQTLNTMFDAYPRRSDFYRKQLIHLLLLCRDNNVDPLSISGSYGGAFGQTQFIPSSFREYAVDFDHDGRRDVWKSIPDVLGSIANYLSRYGWRYGTPIYEELGDTLRDPQLTAAYEKGRKGLVPWKFVSKAQCIDLPKPPDEKDLTIVGLELENGSMRYVAGYPNFQAITAWNHSNRYAMAVTELAARLK